MQIKAYVLLIVLLTGCVIDPPWPGKYLNSVADVTLAHSTRYISNTGTELVFETNLIVLNTYYVGFDNDFFNVNNFKVSGGAGTYEIESFKGYQVAGPPDHSSIAFVIDQSGGYEEIDRFNSRAQAVNKFFRDIAPPNSFLTGASSRKGMLSTEPLELYSAEFDNDFEAKATYVFDLAGRTGGLNSILDAADQSIDLLVSNPGVARKELVLLVHSNDQNSAASPEDVILKAKDNGIRIHVISLGDEPDAGVFSSLSQETGGLFAPCSNIEQMVKVFSELERLINGDTFIYELRIRYKPGVPIEPGSDWMYQIDINDEYSDEGYNYVRGKITIPL